MSQFQFNSKTFDRHRFSPVRAADGAGAISKNKATVLMVGMHLTKTRGGITTLTADILNSSLTRAFNFIYVASQAEDFDGFRKALLAVYAAFRFTGICLFRRPRLVYVHVGSNASLYRESAFILLAKLFRKKILVHFHAGDVREYLQRQPKTGKRFIRWALGLSDRVIAVSEESAKHLAELDETLKIGVVPNAIDTSVFNKISRPSRTHTDKNVRLLFVGAVGKLKGEKDLIKALAILKCMNMDVKASFLGYDAESLADYCEQLDVADMLGHLGPVDMDKRVSHFGQADIFVLPTYAEAMPISVIEAMAAGLPVVTTPVGGIPEIVTDGEDGLLFPCGNVEVLAEKIKFLINNPKDRVAMGKKARSKVREQMDFAAYTTRLRTELLGVISSD